MKGKAGTNNGSEVGTEQVLEPERMKSDGSERLQERRTTNGHLEWLCCRLENPESTDPFAKKRHLFYGEKKGRQLTCHPLGAFCC